MSAFTANPVVGGDTAAGDAVKYASAAKSIFSAANDAYNTAYAAMGKVSNSASLAALQDMLKSAYTIDQNASTAASAAAVAADSAVTKSTAR